MMNLDEVQRKKVSAWIAEGLKLSEIQSRLAKESSIALTYMEVRLLVDDLKLVPKDAERPKATASTGLQAPAAPPTPASQPADSPKAARGVAVTVDQLARPGALVSGKVTFSDGQSCDWYLDQNGRLGVVPKQAGYKPPAGDMPQFQTALENELARIGF